MYALLNTVSDMLVVSVFALTYTILYIILFFIIICLLYIYICRTYGLCGGGGGVEGKPAYRGEWQQRRHYQRYALCFVWFDTYSTYAIYTVEVRQRLLCNVSV